MMSSSLRRMLPLPHSTLATVRKWNNGTRLSCIFRGFAHPGTGFIPHLLLICPQPKVPHAGYEAISIQQGCCCCCFLYHIEANVMNILYAHCSVCLHVFATAELCCFSCFWCYCASSSLISRFVCLCSLPLAYVHPTHTSHQPLELRVVHHAVALQPASACRLWSCSSRLTVDKALEGYSRLLPLLLVLMTC